MAKDCSQYRLKIGSVCNTALTSRRLCCNHYKFALNYKDIFQSIYKIESFKTTDMVLQNYKCRYVNKHFYCCTN